MATIPPLGWVEPKDRTQEQNDAHDAAIASMPKFAITGGLTRLAKGEKIILGKFWKDPRVVQEVGMVFPRFHQLTGSCVGASCGTALFSLIAVQRCLAENPTTAFIPFWLYNYGRGRLLAGFRGQGEGSIDSYQVKQIVGEGVVAISSSLPAFQNRDGLVVLSSTEMQWSDGNKSASLVEGGKQHPLGTGAIANDTDTVYQGIINGYPYLFGCDNFVPNGHITGTGKDAYVSGTFGSRGGHSTGIHGVWEHPNAGTLFLYQNNWPASVYPADPQGETPPCCVWLTEAELSRTWSSLSGKNEGFLLSHLNWFPAQPEVADYTP